MSTTTMLAEYVIIGAMTIFPLIFILFFAGIGRSAAVDEAAKTLGVTIGVFAVILSYTTGVIIDVASRLLFKRKERRIVGDLLAGEFRPRLPRLISGADPSASQELTTQDLTTEMNSLPEDCSILLRRLRYRVYVSGGAQAFAILTTHNHLKRITRAMTLVAPIVSCEVASALTIGGARLAASTVGVLGVLLAVFFYTGSVHSSRSHARSIIYSFLSLPK